MRTLAAQPGSYAFPLSGVALVVIDMQRDFLEPGGFGAMLGNEVSRLAPAIPAIAALLATFRGLGLPIIHTREGHLEDLSDCPPSKLQRGTPSMRIGDQGPLGRILVRGQLGNQIIPELSPRGRELVIDKPGKGAFYGTSLDDHLHRQAITHLMITGVTTEVCVQTTMREANDRGYDCVLVEDATESYFPQFKQATIEMIRAQGGIVGWTATSQAVHQALR